MTTIPYVSPTANQVRSPGMVLWTRFAASPFAVVALIMLIVVILLAVLAPWIAPQDPYDLSSVKLRDARLPPLSKMMSGKTAWLGTDGAGRDLLSAMLFGLRTSLLVGISSGLMALALGTMVGLVSGYVGGRTDTILMRIVDLQLSFPAILIALVLIAIWGRGVDKVILALVIVQWAYYARAARASAMVERQKEYIMAAQCLVTPPTRLLLRHLLPNCLPALIVVASVQTANAIALEATLSFLGVGVPVTEPSLGLLISNGFDYMLSQMYWISLFPGLLLLLLLVLINLLGDRLREVLNPRLAR